MRIRHIACCLLATSVAFALPSGLSTRSGSAQAAQSEKPAGAADPQHGKGEPEHGKGEPPAPSVRIAPPPLDSPSEPDIASCVNGFLTAREWVSALKVPEASAPESGIPLPGVRGICVLLRFEGRIIGSGEEWPGTVGDDRMLRRAISRAVASTLGDELIRGLDPAARATAGTRLAMEIEFAGRPEPLLGRVLDECAARIDRGLDGIALRRGYAGSISWHIAFPCRMLASNTARDPHGTLMRLVRESGLPDKDLPELARIEPVGVFRFTSLRLAQASADAPPAPRGRGVTRVIDSEITRASVTAHAMAILRRAIRALPPSEGVEGLPPGIGSFGNYIPVRDAYEPLIAPPQDQAFLAWAAAAVATSKAFSDAERREALALTRRLLDDFIETTPTESQPLAVVPAMVGFSCAVELLMQDEISSPNADNAEPLSDDVMEAARLSREKLADRLARGNSLNERALAAIAASMTVGTERRFIPATELHKIIDSLWQTTEKPQLIGVLPWLVLADSYYARATGEPGVHVVEGQALMKALLLVQAGFSELAAEQDLRGGFRLTGERRAGVTSQSLRPGLALAALLCFSGFVPISDQDGLHTLDLFRTRLIALLRFSQELTISGDLSAFYRNPGRVEGGIREALWDSEQHVAANAMAVLVDVFALQADPWSPLPTAPVPASEPPQVERDPDHGEREPGEREPPGGGSSAPPPVSPHGTSVK